MKGDIVYIQDQVWYFNKAQIQSNLPFNQKRALQTLCLLLRKGQSFKPEHELDVEGLVLGVLSSTQDQKVIRWCFNTLAQIASPNSFNTILSVSRRYQDIPEIVGASITAMSKALDGYIDDDKRKQFGIDPKLFNLAALQNTAPHKLNLSGLDIDIETEDAEILKLGLILVGTGKDVENLFHPRISNAELIKVLASHDDPIVRQYSIWGLIENKHVEFSKSEINFDGFETEPVNVQAKILQLGASRLNGSLEKQELVEKGSHSPEFLAREGLAKGLQYFEGLSDQVLPWLEREQNPTVRNVLLQHIASSSGKNGDYFDTALSIYETQAQNRNIIEIGAINNSRLAKRLANIEQPLEGELFGDPHATIVQSILEPPSKFEAIALFTNNLAQKDLALSRECRALEEISATPNLKIRTIIAANSDDFYTLPAPEKKYNIIHIASHGGIDCIPTMLQSGEPFAIDITQLSRIINDMGGLECLFINACNSRSFEQELRGNAAFLILCEGDVDDDIAIKFAEFFYSFLAGNPNIRHAYGQALKAMETEYHPDYINKHLLTIGGLRSGSCIIN